MRNRLVQRWECTTRVECNENTYTIIEEIKDGSQKAPGTQVLPLGYTFRIHLYFIFLFCLSFYIRSTTPFDSPTPYSLSSFSFSTPLLFFITNHNLIFTYHLIFFISNTTPLLFNTFHH
jgi:hypothetical protein